MTPQICPNDDPATCAADCKKSYTTFPGCTAELDAAFQCAVGRPASDYQCDADGTAEIKPGVCDAEVKALQACLF